MMELVLISPNVPQQDFSYWFIFRHPYVCAYLQNRTISHWVYLKWIGKLRNPRTKFFTLNDFLRTNKHVYTISFLPPPLPPLHSHDQRYMSHARDSEKKRRTYECIRILVMAIFRFFQTVSCIRIRRVFRRIWNWIAFDHEYFYALHKLWCNVL